MGPPRPGLEPPQLGAERAFPLLLEAAWVPCERDTSCCFPSPSRPQSLLCDDPSLQETGSQLGNGTETSPVHRGVRELSHRGNGPHPRGS